MRVELPCGKFTEIDDQDAYLKDVFPHWRAHKHGHVIVTRYIKTEYGVVRQDVYLHKIICKPVGSLIVDHKDRNPLNNKRSNLRYATFSQNNVNRKKYANKTSKYHGVSLCRSANKNPWRVFIRTPEGKRITGSFNSEEEAARFYDAYAQETWGEFAPLNFDVNNEL